MGKLVKICGLRTAGEVAAALAAGADLVGFVIFPPSPRNIAIETAAPLVAAARGRARTVALTVDPDAALIDRIVSDLAPDFIQFHGSESRETLRAVRGRGVGTVKAVGVARPADREKAAAYADVADMLILDAKPPKDATRPGGHGQAFDWSLLDGFDPGVPWLLSGGLSPENVGAALARTNAAGVDVSSGVESEPGVKDPALIRRFVAAVRKAETGLAA